MIPLFTPFRSAIGKGIRSGRLPLARAISGSEPPYMIEFDEHYVDPKTIPVPYLRDSTRVEMYEKHKADPKAWDVKRLSQHYGTSLDRTNAVLFLMKRREEVQRNLGAVDLSPEHKSMYEKHVSDPETHTAEKLSEEYGINVQQVHEILQKLEIHFARLRTLHAAEEHMNAQMAQYEDEGVDTTFREIPKESQLEMKYTPRVFGDDEEQEAIADLKRLIARDTRAEVVPTVEDFLRNADRSQLVAPEQPNRAQVKTDHFSRWKFAFRDSSKIDTQPTMIRTRNGG